MSEARPAGKLRQLRSFLGLWKEQIILSLVAGAIIFSPTVANWWENWRLYRLRQEVRSMTPTGDFYQSVPGWVRPEDLTEWNRENDPQVLKKKQLRAKLQQRPSSD